MGKKDLGCQYHNRHQRAARKMHHINCKEEEILHFIPTQKYKADTLSKKDKNMVSLDQNEASSERDFYEVHVKNPC